MPIPLMSDEEMERATARNKKLWAFIRINKWSRDDVLRALFCYVLDGEEKQLDRAIDWFDEFLGDLRDKAAEATCARVAKAARKRKKGKPS